MRSLRLSCRARVADAPLGRVLALLLIAWLACLPVRAHAAMSATHAATARGFELVALGVEGGLDQDDLSAYLLRAPGDTRYLALDAGTLVPGIRRALARGARFATPPGVPAPDVATVLRQRIAAYFISHAHLDHVGGLLIAAPEDAGSKPVYGLASTLDALARDDFNNVTWPNFSDRGQAAIGRYRLIDETPGAAFPIAGTTLTGTLLPLWHDRVVSSMLLARAGAQAFAYFGDTGPDALASGHDLADAWRLLAPLVARHRLAGLLIEVSYPDGTPDTRLYGHLTPTWLLRELRVLERDAGGPGALRGLNVIVGHIKPSLARGVDPRATIAAQLAAGNTLGVHFLFPRQGDVLHLPD